MALIVDSTTYSLVLNSVDRISGTNNNATFQVNWKDFLPDDFQSYKVGFSFQSSGGYYSDGIFANTGTTGGMAIATITSSSITAIGSQTIALNSVFGIVIGQTLISSSGIPSGCTVTSITPSAPTSIAISSGTLAALPSGTSIQFFNPTGVNQVTFSSARVLFMNQGRSFSFDTYNKGPSTNIGILQRDIQVSTSKSNSLSCFYCQNPPRTIDRPNQNQLTVSIMNNYSFAGGPISYVGTTATYSTVSTNQNYLCDTNSTGSVMSNDMTPYTMIMEFIPIASSQISKHGRAL